MIISFEQESYTTAFLDLFYALYRNNPIVPANKLIHITAAYNMHEIYDQYCIANNILDKEKIQIWFSTYSLLGPIKINSTQSLTKTTKVKKFINFNRYPRSHRLCFTSLLAEYNLLDDGYISLGVHENQTFQSNDDILIYINHNFPKIYKWDIDGEGHKLLVSGSKKLVNALPLTIDTNNFTYGPKFAWTDDHLMDFYNKSYFSIVSSTYYFYIDEKAITLNEKEYKPILAKQPFILVTKPGTLALLKTLGFKTFDKWFDESYDNETDDEARMLKLINEVNRLCKIDDMTWNNMLEEMQPILEYNYDWILNHTSDIIFRTDFKHILEYAK